MCDPVKQDYHSTARFDDPKIEDAHRLLRHCFPPVQIVPCSINGRKISDQAFKGKKSDPGLSVDIECLVEKVGKTWVDRFGVMPNSLALLAVNAGDARKHSRGVAWTPKPKEDLEGYQGEPNPFHGEIIHPMSSAEARDLYRKSVVLKSALAA